MDYTCHAKIDGNNQFWPGTIIRHDGNRERLKTEMKKKSLDQRDSKG